MGILRADARALPIKDEVVQAVITSPPYWGLRDYGTGHWEGGVPFSDKPEGTPACSHSDGYEKGREDYGVNDYPSIGYAKKVKTAGFGARTSCSCGAVWVDPAIGLEDSIESYLEQIVAVFQEVKRVLKPDGLIFVNIGDTYSGSGRGAGGSGSKSKKQMTNKGSYFLSPTPPVKEVEGHQLLGIPWRVAFALQKDGWFLRSSIIWRKPNPMPECLTTKRPTQSYEFIFMLSKSGMDYFWGYPKEPVVENRHSCGRGYKRTLGKSFVDQEGNTHSLDAPWETMKMLPGKNGVRGNQSWGQYTIGAGKGPDERNIRDVWDITVEHSAERHYAQFPEELVLRCLLAGTAAGDLVLDPFGGVSTVGVVAERTGRKWLTTELSAEYCQAARRRTAQIGLFK